MTPKTYRLFQTRSPRALGVLLAVLLLTGAVPGVAGTPPQPESAEVALQQQGPIQVGEVIRLTYRSPALAKPSVDGQPSLAWREELYMPGASYIAPHFSHFNLPPGAELIVRGPDGSRSWSYTRFGKGERYLKDGFWGIHIPGDIAVVELYSKVPLPAAVAVIDSFAHGNPDFDTAFSAETEAICGADDSRWAKCYQSSQATAYNRAKAVARLLINGTGACTGWLVGNQGHLMTNNHCIGSSSDALNTNYEFMAEGSSCTTNCASWLACPGAVVATSATLVKTHVNLDYTLVKLPTNVSGTYGYLQLRNTGAVVNERIYIPGHPQGWGKRIALQSSHSTAGSGYCEVYSLNQPACIGGSVGEVGYYCDTQGGNSGSPVLADSDHCVVALHHCASCPNRGVRIQNIISNLGSSLPSNALCSSSPPTTDNSQFISQSVPAALAPGATATVSVTMKNTGTSTWTRAAGFKLGSQNPQDNLTWGRGRVLLSSSESIAPGQQKTFTFTITAPSIPGTYNFQWRMLQEFMHWFGQYSTNKQIQVN